MEVSSPLATYSTLDMSLGLSGPQFTQEDSKSFKQDSFPSIQQGCAGTPTATMTYNEMYSRQEEGKESAIRLHTCVSPTTLTVTFAGK